MTPPIEQLLRLLLLAELLARYDHQVAMALLQQERIERQMGD